MEKIELVSGAPVPKDRSHTELKLNGQQKDYVILSSEERAKGFVKPVRTSYFHHKCKTITTMALVIAETYARNPSFYTGTFCVNCQGHFPLAQFQWEPDGEPMEPTMQGAT